MVVKLSNFAFNRHNSDEAQFKVQYSRIRESLGGTIARLKLTGSMQDTVDVSQETGVPRMKTRPQHQAEWSTKSISICVVVKRIS